MKRKIVIGVLILIVVAAIIGYRMYSKQTPDIVQDKPDITVTVKDLIAAFEKDTAAASKLYIDKIIEVTGLIKSVDTSGAVVMGEEGNPSDVVVGLDRRHLNDVVGLKEGSVAVMQGICSGYNKSSGNADDLLAGLGATIQVRSAGLKAKK
ncbi:MAG: OB-fold putative lipoprotein [Bacteroidota bacterium]|nr:OB-fold putative lipoprotein [Bacteroidota bacterium]